MLCWLSVFVLSIFIKIAIGIFGSKMQCKTRHEMRLMMQFTYNLASIVQQWHDGEGSE